MAPTAILAFLFVLASSASAQTMAPPPSATADGPAQHDPDIVVQHRTDDAIARLVEALTATRRGNQVARWNDAICLRVLGLDDGHAALMQDRIKAVAKMLNVAVAKEPCRPSLNVIVTDHADRIAKMFVDLHPGLYGNPNYGIRHGVELEELKQSRPVRWIDATSTGGADGTGGGFALGSRIQSPTRENMFLSLVIVDAQRLTHITWGQLSDYLALVTLARPRLAATPPDSIMSIFAARDAGTRGPPGLTPTDLAFLQGLYRSDPSLSAGLQRSQIADRVRKGTAR